MKTIAYYLHKILFSVVLFAAGCSQNGEFRMLDGKYHSLNDFNGKWLVINFWAEWCAPCYEEVPALNQLARQGLASDIRVIGISYDLLSNEKLREVVKKWDIQYPVMDTEPVPVLPFSLPATLPTNYLINPEGEVVQKLVGTQTFQGLVTAINNARKMVEK